MSRRRDDDELAIPPWLWDIVQRIGDLEVRYDVLNQRWKERAVFIAIIGILLTIIGMLFTLGLVT